jgi:hypothetical protein
MSEHKPTLKERCKHKLRKAREWYRANRHRLRLTASCFAATVIGGLLPLYLGALVLYLAHLIRPQLFAEMQAKDFYENGEFALYAAAFVAPMLYQLFRDLKTPFPHRMVLGLGSVVVLVLATGIFSAVALLAKIPRGATESPAVAPLGWATLALLLVSMVLSTLTTYFDITLSDIDMQRSDDQNVDDLAKKLAAIGGGT